MKKLTFIFISIVILLALGDSAMGACDCRQPAYRDEIDFLTRYTACLAQCYNSQFESLKQRIHVYDQRIADLVSEIDRLKGKIEELEGELSSAKNKKGEQQ